MDLNVLKVCHEGVFFSEAGFPGGCELSDWELNSVLLTTELSVQPLGILFLIFFFVCVHGAEDQTSSILCMLDKQSTFEVHPKSLMF